MVVNTTASPITVGRFRILPGEKLPAVTLTDQEQADVTRLLGKGMFRKTGTPAVEQPRPKPVPQAPTPTVEEPTMQPVESGESSRDDSEEDSEEKATRRSRNKR